MNVDQLASEDLELSARPAGRVSPLPPAPIGAVEVRLRSRPAENLRDPAQTSEGSVQAALESQQSRALGSFVAGLEAVDETEARVLRVKNQQALKKTLMGLSDNFAAQLQGMFARYAKERAPKVIELSNLLGDADPKSSSATSGRPVPPYVRHQADEVKRVRAELAAIDRDFDEEKNNLLSQLKLDRAKDLANFETEISDYQTNLDLRAARLAQEEVATNAAALGLRLVHATARVLPAIPAQTIAIPAEPPFSPAPKVPSEQISRGIPERRRLIRQELAIWLALNRYRESPAGRDATKEFQKWREMYRAGL